MLYGQWLNKRSYSLAYPSRSKEYRSDYNKQYYQKKHTYFKAAKRRRKEEIDEFVRQQKVGLFCKRCNNSDIRVLDFHHRDRDGKEVGISYIRARGWSDERILREIARCEVLCANCHRIEHWEEKNPS
jgi:hypothetical protein